MGRWSSKPSGSRFIKAKCYMSGRFVIGGTEQWNMGRWPLKPSQSRLVKEKCLIFDRFGRGGGVNSGIWVGGCQRRPGGRFTNEKCWICNWFTRGLEHARTVEYGLVAAKAVREQIHKRKVLDFR